MLLVCVASLWNCQKMTKSAFYRMYVKIKKLGFSAVALETAAGGLRPLSDGWGVELLSPAEQTFMGHSLHVSSSVQGLFTNI